MKTTTAHIIAIGDEILYGQTLDTNSHFIAKQLSILNIDLIEITIISDEESTITDTLKGSNADIIITTGGLGPTRDDKTKLVISKLLKKDLILNKEALDHIANFYEKVVKRPMNELNREQALIPEGSTILKNEVGTAPGIWSKWGDKVIINLPGVPYEMKYLLTAEVLPKIKAEFNPKYIIHKFVNVIDIPESELADILSSFEDTLPNTIKLAYLPSSKLVKLRLTSAGIDLNDIERSLILYKEKIIALISDNVVSSDDKSLDEKIASILNDHKLTLSTAESFTSGKIGAKITSISGSSSYYKGGIIAYSPQLKEQLLSVSKDLIDREGVVNESVAREMAIGALQVIGTDIAISSTGVAGPDKDEFGVSPGTAYIGIASVSKTMVYKFEYNNLERNDFSDKLTELAIQRLYVFLKENYD